MNGEKNIFDLVRALIEENPQLSAAIDSLPPRLTVPLEDRYIGKNEKKLAIVPRPVIALQKTEGIALTWVIQPERAYFFVYTNAKEQRVGLPAGHTFKAVINHDSLEAFLRECEQELNHRGFRPAQKGKQIDENSTLIAKSFTFHGLPPQFGQEAFALMSYFQIRYK